MLVKFLRPWRRWKPGDRATLDDGVATTLVRRGHAVEVAARKRREAAMLSRPEAR